ncbi:MAG: FtsX-like permease family protein, partial [Bryobacteraceae bacterium]
RKELAIRAALGATRGQVVRPVLLETTLLSVAGGMLGLLFAQWAQSLVLNALADQMPRFIDVQLDARVLAFTMLASVLTGFAAGLIACWRLASPAAKRRLLNASKQSPALMPSAAQCVAGRLFRRIDLNESLKQGLGKTDAFSGGTRTRSLLVVAEVALSLVLLIGAGLMIRSLWALHRVDPGFVSSGVVTMSIPIPESSNGSNNATGRTRFYDEFLPQVRRLPGVISAAAITTLPLVGGGPQQPIVIEGRPAEVFALQPNVGVRDATPGYIRTMGIPLLAGRDFEEADTADGESVILISQALARQFWPGENPIGKRLRISFSPEVSREVVGVVGDVKERGLDVLEPLAMLYRPLPQNRTGSVSLVVRSDRNAPALVPAITDVLQQMNPELPVRNVRTMDELVAESLSQHRFSMYLFAALASLAFALAAVGIYSVLAYTVRSRAQEISIRLALGAQVRDVLALVVIEGMKPALAGIAAGAFGAWMLGGVLSRLIFGISPADPYTFAAVALLLAAVALLACLLPAYRAARTEPVTALRNE